MMGTLESGTRLLRRVSLLCRRKLLSQTRGPWPGSGIVFRNQASCFPVVLQEQRHLGGLLVSPVKFYSLVATGSQTLPGSQGKPRASITPGDVVESPLLDSTGDQGKSQRLFYDRLKSCSSPMDVLDLSNQYTMTWQQTSNSLTRIWKTLKTISEEQRPYQQQLVFEHPAFEELCRSIMTNSHRMQPDDLVYSLLATVRLGVPTHSRVVQTLLRASQENLNNFDDKCLSILSNCLVQMKSCSSVVALKKGLGLLAWSRVPDIKHVTVLQSLMRCLGSDVTGSLKKRLEEKALSMADQFTLPNAQYMFISLATMNLPSKPLLDICRDILVENIQDVPFNRLNNVLKACKVLGYRDKRLLSSIVEHVESTFDMWSNKQIVLLLLIFEELGFCPTSLLDKFAEKVIQDSASLTRRDLLSTLKVYSLLNYLPQHCRQEFLEAVTSSLESYLSRMKASELLRSVYFLCILHHFPPAPLERLLTTEVLPELMAEEGSHLRVNKQRLHTVDLCLRLDLPPLPQTLEVPPTCVLPPSRIPTDNKELTQAVQNVVGDNGIQERVQLENGYFIDCVITWPLDKTDGEPLPPEQCQRLAVLFIPPSLFCFGTRHPRGKLAVKLRHLKLLGYTPVLVPQSELEALSQEEREEVLRNLLCVKDESRQERV